MKKRTGAVAGMPTALVASTARLRTRRRRGRRRRTDLKSLTAISEPLRAVPEAVERVLPRRRRSAIGRLRRRRRGTDLMRMARHAGTAVSAVGFAADLLNQINAISEAAERSRPEPGRQRRPQAERTTRDRKPPGDRRASSDRREAGERRPSPDRGAGRERATARKPAGSASRNGSRSRPGARAGAANSDHPTDDEE